MTSSKITNDILEYLFDGDILRKIDTESRERQHKNKWDYPNKPAKTKAAPRPRGAKSQAPTHAQNSATIVVPPTQATQTTTAPPATKKKAFRGRGGKATKRGGRGAANLSK